jgi:hypothetical protein
VALAASELSDPYAAWAWSDTPLRYPPAQSDVTGQGG